LKSRAIWLKCGDENTKFFQAYAKGRKFTNSIWALNSAAGEQATSFDGLAELGVRHLGSFSKNSQGLPLWKSCAWLSFFQDLWGMMKIKC